VPRPRPYPPRADGHELPLPPRQPLLNGHGAPPPAWPPIPDGPPAPLPGRAGVPAGRPPRPGMPGRIPPRPADRRPRAPWPPAGRPPLPGPPAGHHARPWPPAGHHAGPWPPAGRAVPPFPRQSTLLALLFRFRPRSHARALTAGLALGLLWWFAVSLTLLPLLSGGRPAWTMASVGDQLPKLLAVALLSSLAGLLFQEAAIRHLGGERGTRPGDPARPRARVVILGGGFGGVTVARRLERLLPRVPGMEVVIVSQSNALLFTPMLAEVASRSLEPNHVGVSVRAACPRTRFRLAEVDRVDTTEQLVHLRARGSASTETLP
jgi:hypothetical protein